MEKQQRREISEDRAKLDELRSKCKIREETYKIEIEKLRQKLDKIRCKFEQQQKQRQSSQEMHRLKEENMLLKSQVHYHKQQIQQSYQTSKLLISARESSPPKQLERSPIQLEQAENQHGSASKIKKQLATTDMELVKLAQHKLMKENKSLKKRVDLMQGQMKEIFEILVEDKTLQTKSNPQLSRIPLEIQFQQQQLQQQQRNSSQIVLGKSGIKLDEEQQLGVFSEKIEETKQDFLRKIKNVFEKHQSQNDIFLQKNNQMKEALGSKLLESDSSDLSSCIDSISEPSQASSRNDLNQKIEPLKSQSEVHQGIDASTFQRNNIYRDTNAFQKNSNTHIPFDQKVAQIIREQRYPQKQQIAIPTPIEFSQKRAGENQLSVRSRQSSQHKDYNLVEGSGLRATFLGNGDTSRKGSEFRSIKEQYQSVLNSQNHHSNLSIVSVNSLPIFQVNPPHPVRPQDHLNQFQVPKHYNSTASPNSASQPNTLITTNYTSFQANGGLTQLPANNSISVSAAFDSKRNSESIPFSLIDSMKKDGSLTSRTYENKQNGQQVNEKITDEYIKQIIQQYKTPKKTSPPPAAAIVPTQTANQAQKKTIVVIPPVEIPQFISSNQPRILSARGAYERDATGLLSSPSAQISPNRISKTSRTNIQPSAITTTNTIGRTTLVPSSNFLSGSNLNQPPLTQNFVSIAPQTSSQIPLSRETSLSYNCYFSNQPNTINTSPINKKIISINPGPIVAAPQPIVSQISSLSRDQFNLNHKRQQSCGTQAGANKHNLKLNLTSLASPKQSYQYSDRQYSDRPTYNNLLSSQRQKQSYESISISHSPIFSHQPHSQPSQINRFYKK